MKKIALLLFGIVFTTFALKAQIYNTGIGLRGGLYNGLTIKHFTAKSTALEGIVSSRWSGIQATGLIEFHNQIGSRENFQWFYGIGGHVGFYDGKHTPISHQKENGAYTIVGIDAIVGLEYAFSEIPFSIGLDYKPAINLIGKQYFTGDAGALSIRYIF